MSQRRTDFGRRPTGSVSRISKAMADTRNFVEGQGPAAGFTTAPETRQWTCRRCRMVNTSNRDHCRACGVQREERA